MTRFTALALPLALLDACAPAHIARSACQSEMLSTDDRWACTLSGPRIEQASSLEFDTESRNHVAKVKLSLAVAKGKLRVGYRDLGGEKHVVVTPEAPAFVEMQTRLHRERRSFSLYFEPVDGHAEGLTGTVDYSTP